MEFFFHMQSDVITIYSGIALFLTEFEHIGGAHLHTEDSPECKPQSLL